jgi:hypothetical protein
MLPTTLSLASVPVVSTLSYSTPTHIQLQPPPGGTHTIRSLTFMQNGKEISMRSCLCVVYNGLLV